jgi:5-methylcytosine-specific restriction protein A
MATELSERQWTEILLNEELTKSLDLGIFQTLYAFEGHKAYASQVGIILGYKGKSPQAPLNLEIGRYAKRIAKYYDIDFTRRSSSKYKFWDIFFNGWDHGKYFVWQLKPELVKALRASNLTGENQSADELPMKELEGLAEGAKRAVIVNAYERNSKARQLCIEHWGLACSICEMDFKKFYGEVGNGFIHVHHLTPLSQIGNSYQIDPINDLRPICPNCHSMLHRRDPPLEIEELKDLIGLAKNIAE